MKTNIGNPTLLYRIDDEEALDYRAGCNRAARRGEYNAAMERV
jgi:hypothetical protein